MDRGAKLNKIRRDIDRRNKTDMKLYPWMVFAVILLYTFVAFYRGLFFGNDPEINEVSIHCSDTPYFVAMILNRFRDATTSRMMASGRRMPLSRANWMASSRVMPRSLALIYMQ